MGTLETLETPLHVIRTGLLITATARTAYFRLAFFVQTWRCSVTYRELLIQYSGMDRPIDPGCQDTWAHIHNGITVNWLLRSKMQRAGFQGVTSRGVSRIREIKQDTLSLINIPATRRD